LGTSVTRENPDIQIVIIFPILGVLPLLWLIEALSNGRFCRPSPALCRRVPEGERARVGHAVFRGLFLADVIKLQFVVPQLFERAFGAAAFWGTCLLLGFGVLG